MTSPSRAHAWTAAPHACSEMCRRDSPDDLVPAFCRLVSPEPPGIVESRAVDQHIDPAVTVEYRARCAVYRVGIAHVQRFDLGLSAGRPNGIRLALQQIGAPPRHDHRRACGAEALGARQSHAGPGAGHPRHLTVETAHRRTSLHSASFGCFVGAPTRPASTPLHAIRDPRTRERRRLGRRALPTSR